MKNLSIDNRTSRSYLFDNDSLPNLISRKDIELKCIDSSNTDLLRKAFELAFLVYVTEKEYVSPNQLTQDQMENRAYYDIFDLSPTTKHIIALREGKVIGRTRYTDGVCPVSMHYDLSNYLLYGPIREISRIITHPDERKSLDLLLNLCNYAYNASKHLGQFFCTSFDDGANFYKGLGADEIGTFENPEYPLSPTSHVFRWDVESLEDSYNIKPFVKKRFVSEMIKPL